MTDGRRIVLAGAGDQEVSVVSIDYHGLGLIHPSDAAWPSTWRCYLRTKNPTTRIIRTFWERLTRYRFYYPLRGASGF
jgi:hypothetical protein